MTTDYSYQLADFTSLDPAVTGPSLSQLTQEIQSSAITVALDHLSGSTVISFKAALTSQEKILLDQLVAAHTGVGITDPTNTAGVPYMVLSGDQNVVQIAGRKGSDLIAATHNFADPTTWFQGSTRTTDTLTDSGDGLTFNGHHQSWIDLTHGKYLYERNLVAEDITAGGKGWAVSVTVDGVTQTQRTPFDTSGGDFTVDYAAGTITFASSKTGTTVVAEYNYSGSSQWELVPDAGKELEIIDSELQFSIDAQLQSAIVYEIVGPVENFAPTLAVSGGGPLPDGTLIRLGGKDYDTIDQLIDDARGAYPQIPAMPGPRGYSQARIGFPFWYGTINELYSSQGMRLRVRVEGDVPILGERGTGTMYCLSKTEST